MTPLRFFIGLPLPERRSARRFVHGRVAVAGLLACVMLAATLGSCLARPAAAAHADAPAGDQLTAVAVQPFAMAESVKRIEGTTACVCSTLERPAILAWRSLNVPLRTPRRPVLTLVGLDVRLQI